ncbi:MAG: sulfatase, partial [Pirellulaceae bacterium]|nr:sulfatase [Pirellulaceae bacterium]
HSVDGRSITSLLRNPNATLDRNLYWHYPPYHAGGDGPDSAVRSGPFRLIEFHEDNSIRLYNLESDLGERNDLSSQLPEKAVELRQDLHDWRHSVAAQMPTPNPHYDPDRSGLVRKKK